MQLILSNGQTVDLVLNQSSLSETYQKIYKHLSHLEIPFNSWDNPYHVFSIGYETLVEHLIQFAKKVNVDVDKTKCLIQDQQYFNQIHKIYEQGYDGRRDWLNFHEHIHLCERYFELPDKYLHIDYREKSGPLEKPMQPEWLTSTTTKIKAGDMFVQWSELGKSPYLYWENNEPNDINRICQLAKPWLKLRPKIYIALVDIDTLENVECEKFETWWADYKTAWCKHWNLEDWTIENMFGCNVFGQVSQIDQLRENLQNNIIPTKVKV
jgi:hypothetical protein